MTLPTSIPPQRSDNRAIAPRPNHPDTVCGPTSTETSCRGSPTGGVPSVGGSCPLQRLILRVALLADLGIRGLAQRSVVDTP